MAALCSRVLASVYWQSVRPESIKNKIKWKDGTWLLLRLIAAAMLVLEEPSTDRHFEREYVFMCVVDW